MDLKGKAQRAREALLTYLEAREAFERTPTGEARKQLEEAKRRARAARLALALEAARLKEVKEGGWEGQTSGN